MLNRIIRFSLEHRLLVLGATSALKPHAGKGTERAGPYPWAGDLLEKKSYRLTSVALANKMARIVWAVLTSRQPYRANYVKPTSS